MQIRDVKNILDAELLSGEELLDTEVRSACGSDMMSDVLAYVKDQAVLLTGLLNQQAIRTAAMMDMVCVVFVRDKCPGEDILAVARENGIAVMKTTHRMFTACGLLYQAGLNGGMRTK
ncbi:MAG: DRTGG domain-containing protein [Oscillospiraceae bacterium]|jgi:predicted transcriptional regulator